MCVTPLVRPITLVLASGLRRRAEGDYAEAASATRPAVTDAQVQVLRAVLSDAAVVELAMMVAVEHQRSRFNGGPGLISQGFAQGACAVGAKPA